MCSLFRTQLLLEVEEVFDDAVVDDRDLAGGPEVRVGVGLSDPAVRAPSAVGDTGVALGRVEVELAVDLIDLADALSALDRVVVQRRNAHRVIAAVFQTTHALSKLGRDPFKRSDTDNTAHALDS